MKRKIKKVVDKISQKGKLIDEAARYQAVEMVEKELSELEHIFSILTFGAFVGLPAPPMHITLDLLPYSERELLLLFRKVDTAYEPISMLASIFSID